MAFEANIDEDNKTDGEVAEGQQPTSSGSAYLGQGSGSTPEKPKTTGVSGQKHSGMGKRTANLRKYIDAGKNAAMKMGEDIRSKFKGIGSNVRGNIQTAETGLGSRVSEEMGRLGQGEQLVNEKPLFDYGETAKFTGAVEPSVTNQEPQLDSQATQPWYQDYGKTADERLSLFKGLKAGDYAKLNVPEFGKLQSDISGLETDVKSTGSESGRQQLLKEMYKKPEYTKGQQMLDQLILQSQPDVMKSIVDETGSQVKSSKDRLAALQGVKETSQQQIADRAGALSGNIEGKLFGDKPVIDPTTGNLVNPGGVLGGFNERLEGLVSQAKLDAQADYDTLSKKITSGQELTPEELSRFGAEDDRLKQFRDINVNLGDYMMGEGYDKTINPITGAAFDPNVGFDKSLSNLIGNKDAMARQKFMDTAARFESGENISDNELSAAGIDHSVARDYRFRLKNPGGEGNYLDPNITLPEYLKSMDRGVDGLQKSGGTGELLNYINKGGKPGANMINDISSKLGIPSNSVKDAFYPPDRNTWARDNGLDPNDWSVSEKYRGLLIDAAKRKNLILNELGDTKGVDLSESVTARDFNPTATQAASESDLQRQAALKALTELQFGPLSADGLGTAGEMAVGDVDWQDAINKAQEYYYL